LILVTGNLRIAPEAMDKAREPMRAMLDATRREDGCLSYAYAEDVLEPGLLRISERWLNWQTLEAHLKTPHLMVWRAVLKEIGVLHRDVVAYEAGEAREL